MSGGNKRKHDATDENCTCGNGRMVVKNARRKSEDGRSSPTNEDTAKAAGAGAKCLIPQKQNKIDSLAAHFEENERDNAKLKSDVLQGVIDKRRDRFLQALRSIQEQVDIFIYENASLKKEKKELEAENTGLKEKLDATLGDAEKWRAVKKMF